MNFIVTNQNDGGLGPFANDTNRQCGYIIFNNNA